ncbi:hypothetical protein NQZ68_026484 [Dissostichus eleginoides]|nr:hypothetical protein NQZ68_026484 [Dissostichus eleginoides]
MAPIHSHQEAGSKVRRGGQHIMMIAVILTGMRKNRVRDPAESMTVREKAD